MARVWSHTENDWLPPPLNGKPFPDFMTALSDPATQAGFGQNAIDYNPTGDGTVCVKFVCLFFFFCFFFVCLFVFCFFLFVF